MGSTFEDTVHDFDLDFLPASPNIVNECRFDKQKQKQSILKLKRKISTISYAVSKYHETKEQFAQSEVLLLAAKEECKQVCIDYKESLEKCSQLEKLLKSFQEKNKELERNYEMTQNQLKGIESHAKQLQVLVTRNEAVVDGLKKENQLEKTNSNECEKKLLSIEKENKILLNSLCLARDIALGKKKMRKHHKVLLQQYEKANTNGEDSSSESSSEETDLFDSSQLSPELTSYRTVSNKSGEIVLDINNKEEICVLKKDITKNNDDLDSNCSNEIVSEDTGRGSSLAYSDGDKCFNSPDYYNSDSPFIAEFNRKRALMDACTSPIIFNEVVHIATSPLMFNDKALLSDNNTITPLEINSNNTEYIITDIPLSTELVTNKEKKSLVDVGTNTVADDFKINVSTSPIAFKIPQIDQKKCIDSATSPIPNVENCNSDMNIFAKDNTEACNNDVVAKESVELISPATRKKDLEKKHKTIQNLSSQCEIEISNKSFQERICLERHNSKNLCSETSNDCEIEMILNTMRLTDRLITPIPSTPIKLNKNHSRHKLSVGQLTNLPEEHTVCPEATKLREENKILHTNIVDLTEDILKIKSILKKQKLMPESPVKLPSENSNLDNLCNDSTEEIITIEIEIDKDNDGQSLVKNEHESLALTENISQLSPAVKTTVIEEVPDEEPFPILYKVNEEMQPSRTSEIQKTTKNLVKVKSVQDNIFTSTCDINPILENNIEEDTTGENEIEESLTCNKNNGETMDSQNNRVNSKKLSRLDKFRKKLLPKSKIKTIIAPIQKLHSKSKLKPVSNCKNTEAELLLNNKLAYEKARQVMAEMKIKKINEENKESRIVEEKVPKIKDAEVNESAKLNEANNNEIVLRRKSKEVLLSPKLRDIGEIRQPVICLAQLNLNDGWNTNKKRNVQLISPKKSEVIVSTEENLPKRNYINTRSRSKFKNQDTIRIIKFDNNINDVSMVDETEFDKSIKSRMRLKRVASDNLHTDCKRILRSQDVRQMFIDREVQDNETINNSDTAMNTISNKQNCLAKDNLNQTKIELEKERNKTSKLILNNSQQNIKKINNDVSSCSISRPEDSILCKMLQKYGKSKIKFSAKKVPEDISNLICRKLEESIGAIIEMPVGDKSKSAMIKLVEEIQRGWNLKHFLVGLLKYLKDPARKRELFNKISAPPAPPMTKSEQVLLFIMRQLEMSLPNTVSTILTQIEYSLFQLNRTPEFDIIESLSHFYALLCRYFGFKNRLRLFILDAMYCLQFKVVPLIKQCLDVWMHILPLAHMGVAKSTLVTCLVYLLHFYKCEDKFNRIQDIRYILSKKYFYQITDWNETKILEMFRTSLKDLREVKIEKRMLRTAFIILAKRQGPKWCQKNIVKNMLLPMIEKENVSPRIKSFCVEMLGPLLKPYPIDMKVHCEIVVNQLLDMLDEASTDSMKESIFTSLIYMNKHNQSRVTKSLLSWMPKRVSSEFEDLMRDFVQEKPLKTWKRILSRTTL